MLRYLSLCFMTLTGCASVLKSVPADPHTRVDGQVDDWSAAKPTDLKESPISVALQHRESNLFVYLSTGDPRILKTLSLYGLTIWLKERGGAAEMTGVRFQPTMELLQTGAESKANELELERVGAWADGQGAPVGFEGGADGIWVAEIRVPVTRPTSDETELALEVIRPPKRSRRRRPGRASKSIVDEIAAVEADQNVDESELKTLTVWFDVERLASSD